MITIENKHWLSITCSILEFYRVLQVYEAHYTLCANCGGDDNFAISFS